MKLREWLETESKERGLKQQDFAREIGVSLQSLWLYMAQGRVPRPKIIAAISQATGGKVTAADFYEAPIQAPARRAKQRARGAA